MHNFTTTVFIKYLFTVIVFVFLNACATIKPIALFNEAPEDRSHIAYLTMPIEIDVIFFDGVKHTYLPTYQEIVTYALLPGDHIIGLRYQDMVENEDGDNELIKSKPVVIRFNAESNKTYKINFDKPTTFFAAIELEKHLEISLSNESQVIAKSVSAIESPMSDWINNKKERSEAVIFSDNIDINLNMPKGGATVNEHLMFWWKKASSDERDQFKTWLKTN